MLPSRRARSVSCGTCCSAGPCEIRPCPAASRAATCAAAAHSPENCASSTPCASLNADHRPGMRASSSLQRAASSCHAIDASGVALTAAGDVRTVRRRPCPRRSNQYNDDEESPHKTPRPYAKLRVCCQVGNRVTEPYRPPRCGPKFLAYVYVSRWSTALSSMSAAGLAQGFCDRRATRCADARAGGSRAPISVVRAHGRSRSTISARAWWSPIIVVSASDRKPRMSVGFLALAAQPLARAGVLLGEPLDHRRDRRDLVRCQMSIGAERVEPDDSKRQTEIATQWFDRDPWVWARCPLPVVACRRSSTRQRL